MTQDDAQNLSFRQFAEANSTDSDWKPDANGSSGVVVYHLNSRVRIVIENNRNFDYGMRVMAHCEQFPRDISADFADDLVEAMRNHLSAHDCMEIALRFAKELSDWQFEPGMEKYARSDICGKFMAKLGAIQGMSIEKTASTSAPAAWEKQPAIKGKHGGCLNCGPRPDVFLPDMLVSVGFGYAGLKRDNQDVWVEDVNNEQDFMTGERAETLAAADPDHDWRIVLQGPLSNRTYQRHGPNEWVLIEQGRGFA